MRLEQLASEAQINKGYLWAIENQSRNPSGGKLLRIADALDVSMEYLLDETKETPDESVLMKAFFRKFEKLSLEDQHKLMQVMKAWGGKS